MKNSTALNTTVIELMPNCNQRLNNLCGPLNCHIKKVEQHFNISIQQKSNLFQLFGDTQKKKQAADLLNILYKNASIPLTDEIFYQHLTQKKVNKTMIHTKKINLSPKNETQKNYLDALNQYPLTFAIGPAGTGKTYLAVARAVEAFTRGEVKRLVFVRPAVEAGEKLGFLPGDLVEKVLPYLRPIYDALYEMLGFEEVEKLVQKNIIEIAPLAYMRGRTLNDAFIILDEAQNTTPPQMKMFLTRLGFGSTAVITGDITQTDLPQNTISGLSHAISLIKHLDDIALIEFSVKEVVRHPLVSKIIAAYEKSESKL